MILVNSVYDPWANDYLFLKQQLEMDLKEKRQKDLGKS